MEKCLRRKLIRKFLLFRKEKGIRKVVNYWPQIDLDVAWILFHQSSTFFSGQDATEFVRVKISSLVAQLGGAAANVAEGDQSIL